jgi:hypothetical protein
MFFYSSSFYDQRDGLAMELSLGYVITNFYVESFEQQVISLVVKKLTYWYRHVDDTFIVWTDTQKGFSPPF